MERGRSSGRSWLICCFETAACTTAESVKPRISGQRISQPMASAIPSARMTASIIRRSCALTYSFSDGRETSRYQQRHPTRTSIQSGRLEQGLLHLKLPLLRHPVKGGVALEGPHVARKQSEANGASAVAVVDAVDQRREFLATAVVGREQVRLM